MNEKEWMHILRSLEAVKDSGDIEYDKLTDNIIKKIQIKLANKWKKEGKYLKF